MTGGPSRDSLLAGVLREWVSSERIVGGVVLMAERGSITGAAVSGWADRDARLPMQRDTVLRLASMTKLVVSTLALRLCDEGVLSLDDPATRWLPYFRPRLPNGTVPDITLCHLLSHSAGLAYGFEQPPGNPYELARVSDGLDTTDMTLEENLRRLASVPLFFPPGSGWRYSLATDVVGAIVQVATGRSLADLVTQKVLSPLGMESTGFGATSDRRVAPAYWGSDSAVRQVRGSGWYPVDGGRYRLSEDRVRPGGGYDSAGAGMVGTADDYMRLLLCLRAGGGAVLPAESTRRMLSSAIEGSPILSRGAGWSFGLGPMLLTDPHAAGQRQGHGTWSWCGVHGGHYWVDPENDVALVVLTNTGTAGAWGEFADKLVDTIYDAL